MARDPWEAVALLEHRLVADHIDPGTKEPHSRWRAVRSGWVWARESDEGLRLVSCPVCPNKQHVWYGVTFVKKHKHK